MSWDRWHHDPREGEHPEPTDPCPHGVDRREAACGRCLEAAEVEPWGSRRELTPDEAHEALAAFFRATLDQIQQAEDEQMGAHFAARFNRGGDER